MYENATGIAEHMFYVSTNEMFSVFKVSVHCDYCLLTLDLELFV